MAINYKELGNEIWQEIKRQKIKMTDFAKQVGYSRPNMYKILNEGSIDFNHLIVISKLLNRNFLKELGEGFDLQKPIDPVIAQQIEDKRVIDQFMEVMSEVLNELGKEPYISFYAKQYKNVNGQEIEAPLPDFLLPAYAMFFSKRGNLYTKVNNEVRNHYKIVPLKGTGPDEGLNMYAWYSPLDSDIIFDIEMVYRTKEEWKQYMQWAFYRARFYLMNDPNIVENQYIIELINRM